MSFIFPYLIVGILWSLYSLIKHEDFYKKSKSLKYVCIATNLFVWPYSILRNKSLEEMAYSSNNYEDETPSEEVTASYNDESCLYGTDREEFFIQCKKDTIKELFRDRTKISL